MMNPQSPAHVPRGPEPDRTTDSARPSLDEGRVSDVARLVDRVVADHRATFGVLDRDLVRPRAANANAVERHTEVRGGNVVTTTRTFSQTSEGSLGAVLDHELIDARRARSRLLEELRPTVMPVVLDPAMVTREGVLYVPPRLEQALVFGPAAEAKLLAAGYHSAESVIEGDAQRIAAVTGLAESDVRRGQQDLDLCRVAGVDRAAADMLRLAGVHCITRLADRDPATLARDLENLREAHRLHRLPAALAEAPAVARVVSRAREIAR